MYIYTYYVFLFCIIFKICLAIASDFHSYKKIAIPTVNNNCKRPYFSGGFVPTTTKTNTYTEIIINSISVVLTITIGYSDVLTGRVNNLTVYLVLYKSHFSPLTITHSSRRLITCSVYPFLSRATVSVFRFSSDFPSVFVLVCKGLLLNRVPILGPFPLIRWIATRLYPMLLMFFLGRNPPRSSFL